MRIHTNTLTIADVTDAARVAGVTIVGSTWHGSRSRARAIDVGLSGSGRHGGQYGNTDHKSATWDEWGVFLSVLFGRDPSTTIPRVYADADAFHWSTCGRYALDDNGAPAIAIVRGHVHRWDGHDVDTLERVTTVTCTCGAGRRWNF